LAENPVTVYAVLGALALLAGVVAWSSRDVRIPLGSSRDRRKAPRTVSALLLGGLAILVLALLAGGVWLTDRLVETDEEQIEHAVREMAEGARTRDVDRVFRHVSESFRSRQGNDKERFKDFARQHINHGIEDVPVWDFHFEDVSRPKRTASVSFLFKVKGVRIGRAQEFSARCEAKFHLDPDGQWRLQSFQLLNPVTPSDTIPVPF
jgi:hypothetical protein